MPRYVFHMQVRSGELERLRELNEQYADVLRRATKDIAGLHTIEKYLLDDQYVEQIDFDGDFADFAQQLTADRDVREFLRRIDACFVQSLREMRTREMSCIQTLPE